MGWRGGDLRGVECRSGDEGGGRDGEPRKSSGNWPLGAQVECALRQEEGGRKRIILVICNRGIYVSVPGDPGKRELS